MTAGIVLETRGRDRLPADLSYPLGLEALAVGLEGVPHSRMRVYFWKSGPGRLGYHVPCRGIERLHGGDHYRAYKYSEVLAGWQKEGAWAVIVSAVESSTKSVIRRALVSTGLPLLVRWLSTPRAETWHFGERRFQVAFDSEATGICTREIHETSVVDEQFSEVLLGG